MKKYKVGITERGDGALDFDKVIENAQKKNVDGFVLITKAPHKLVTKERVDILKRTNVIIHCTITGFGYSAYGGFLEPKVVHPDRAIEAYHDLGDMFGYDRVVLRIDPIIPIFPFINDAYNVLRNAVFDSSQRVRISFLDYYKHINTRLKNILDNDNILSYKKRVYNYLLTTFNILYNNKLHASVNLRKSAYNLLKFYYNSDFEICAEPDFNCTGCISEKDYKVFGFKVKNFNEIETSKQRKLCKCLTPKIELLDNKSPCYHNCLYCYWQ